MRHIGLIVKGTRLCNLRCTYCHDWRTGPDQIMSFPVLARTIFAALSDPDHDAVDFIWHGGETTMLPIRFYEKAMFVQSRFRRPGQRVSNLIQTNGTRLTADWVRFLRDAEFGVGISLDGPPEVHNQYRVYASGRPSFDGVLRGIGLMKEAGVPFSVLMVLDEDALAIGPDRIFDFFLEHGIKNFGVLPAKPANLPDAVPGTPTTHYIETSRFNIFLARMYDRWCEHGDASIHIRDLDGLSTRIAGKDSKFCTLNGRCFGEFFLVEPDGRLAHCDLFLGDPRYDLGNVMGQDFAAVRRSAKLLALSAENAAALEEMRNCPAFSICNGWCPHSRYISQRHNSMHTDNCCGLRSLIDHIRSRVPPITDRLQEFVQIAS